MLNAVLTYGQSINKVSLPGSEEYYLDVEPESKNIDGVLILLAGFGQVPDDTPPETKLHQVAFKKNILTIFCAGGNKLYADSATEHKITQIINDVLKRYPIKNKRFVIGGFSAGGMLAIRYTELCYEFPEKYPVQPKGVFAVDSPIDIFTIYENLELNAKTRYSELAYEEAVRAIEYIKKDYGIPKENISTYSKLTAFSMNKEYGENEKFLKDVSVRVYHDVDIAWRLKNRNQTVHLSNYEVTAELINRLMLMGNTKAEFMQTFKTGYRANGMRHPHSWSIVDEQELLEWMEKLE